MGSIVLSAQPKPHPSGSLLSHPTAAIAAIFGIVSPRVGRIFISEQLQVMLERAAREEHRARSTPLVSCCRVSMIVNAISVMVV
jgi:hypothetical protein